MKFYDRKEEIALLERIVKQSREQSRMTVLVGRRRIGKTELAKRCGDSLVLYFFVARKAESLLCDDFVREAEAKLGIPIGQGGHTTPDNLQMLCKNCNRLKSDK